MDTMSYKGSNATGEGKVVGPSHSDHTNKFPTHSASDKFGASHKRKGGRREGMHLHETDHHDRMGHTLGGHSAYPSHK